MSEKDYQNTINELLETISELNATIFGLNATISGMSVTIFDLTNTVAELKAQLGMNSTNSSKPPSSDGPKKPPTKSLRKPSGKKPGGQKGHAGSGMKLLHAPDIQELHAPNDCTLCKNAATCAAKRVTSERRHVIDIAVKPVITEHTTLSVLCPQTGKIYKGTFPANVTGTMQYGTELEALAVSLNTIGAVSISRTHEILSGVFGVPISTGTIASMVKSAADAVRPTVNEIKEVIPDEKIAHFDETGTRVNGKTLWAHTSSTENLTYISVEESRGKKGMESAGVVQFFKGIGIHDCWAAYFSYLFVSALCCAHLLRELTGVIDNYGQKWAGDFIELLLGMKNEKERFLEKGITLSPQEVWGKYSKSYDEIVNAALKANPLPPPGQDKKPKKCKPRVLAERLLKRKAEYTKFFTDFTVPFDNNQAERDIRMFKVKQKVSGCFRSKEGADDFATIMSFISTARKRGLSAFVALRDALLFRPFAVRVTE